tara:strand:+ start:17 stop:262 length:246 start_codon:yes stop_codon:yes gene_type:complete
VFDQNRSVDVLQTRHPHHSSGQQTWSQTLCSRNNKQVVVAKSYLLFFTARKITQLTTTALPGIDNQIDNQINLFQKKIQEN